MEVKNIISECLLKMGKEDFSDKEQLSDEEQRILDMLLAALNVAYREIISVYTPLVKRETVRFEGGRLQVEALSEDIIYPVKLTRGGIEIPFERRCDRIEADIDGDAELLYTYMPSGKLALDGKINDIPVDIATVCDGTLGQYYFANRTFDIAESYDTEFRYKMSLAKYRGRRMRLSGGRWRI